jgi:hypothetical protein
MWSISPGRNSAGYLRRARPARGLWCIGGCTAGVPGFIQIAVLLATNSVIFLAWCQSTVVVLNLMAIAQVMLPAFRSQVFFLRARPVELLIWWLAVLLGLTIYVRWYIAPQPLAPTGADGMLTKAQSHSGDQPLSAFHRSWSVSGGFRIIRLPLIDPVVAARRIGFIVGTAQGVMVRQRRRSTTFSSLRS